jgi:hypothetical protein
VERAGELGGKQAALLEGANEAGGGGSVHRFAGLEARTGEGFVEGVIDPGEGREGRRRRWARSGPWTHSRGCGDGIGFGVGESEGQVAEAAEERAEVASGADVGDGVGLVLAEEGVGDAEDFAGDLDGVEPGSVRSEGAPAGEAGVAFAPGSGRWAGGVGLRRVMAAEVLVAEGCSVALMAVAQDVAAFENRSHV